MTPYLSVVMRTRGDRDRPFYEALSSLQAQSDQDFELILMVHSDNAELLARVSEVTAAHAPGLQSRTRVEQISGGGRAVPLNAALEIAAGRRIAFLDDDDALLPNWVEAFSSAEGVAGARLIRAGVLVEQVDTASGDREGAYHDAFPLHFDPLRHVLRNESPFMGWAFPAGLFRVQGLRFDEQLDVCEDWEFVMRAVQIAGVYDVGAYTAVYRHWPGAESSTVTHAGQTWSDAEAEVIRRLNSGRLVLPEGSVPRIRSILQAEEEAAALRETRSWRLAKRLERFWHTASGRRIAE